MVTRVFRSSKVMSILDVIQASYEREVNKPLPAVEPSAPVPSATVRADTLVIPSVEAPISNVKMSEILKDVIRASIEEPQDSTEAPAIIVIPSVTPTNDISELSRTIRNWSSLAPDVQLDTVRGVAGLPVDALLSLSKRVPSTLFVQRLGSTSGSQVSTWGIAVADGIVLATTCEDQDRGWVAGVTPLSSISKEKVKGRSAIPGGLYPLTTSFSPKFRCEMWAIGEIPPNVPGFSGIRIHAGQDATASEGCVTLGAYDRSGHQVYAPDIVRRMQASWAPRLNRVFIATIKQGTRLDDASLLSLAKKSQFSDLL